MQPVTDLNARRNLCVRRLHRAGVAGLFALAFLVHPRGQESEPARPVAIVAEGTMHAVALPNRWVTGTWTQTSGGNSVLACSIVR